MQEYEQLGHTNRINEDVSSMEGELLLPYTSHSFEEFQQYNTHPLFILILLYKVSLQFIIQSITIQDLLQW